jgi:hypothetical protein
MIFVPFLLVCTFFGFCSLFYMKNVENVEKKCAVRDKQMRKTLHAHIVSDVRGLNAKYVGKYAFFVYEISCFLL